MLVFTLLQLLTLKKSLSSRVSSDIWKVQIASFQATSFCNCGSLFPCLICQSHGGSEFGKASNFQNHIL